MAVRPPIDDMEWQAGGAVQLTGPVSQSLRGATFLGLEVSPREAPMVLAGVARLVAEERTIYCADACNRFDVYQLSHWARSMGMDPAELLDRVFLSRAFTVHQLSALATEQLAALATVRPAPLVMVLGLETLFLDEQLPMFEREHHFRKVLRALCELRAAGLSLLATMGQGSSDSGGKRFQPDASRWRRMLSQSVDSMTRLRSLAGGTFVLEHTGGRRGPVFREATPVRGQQLEIVI